MEQAVVLVQNDLITPSDISSRLGTTVPQSPQQSTLVTMEKQAIVDALDKCNWNKSRAAELLGIGRTSLYSKLKKYKISMK
ncbi:helix-turn-helix domain-containing protein [Pseudodesulfovibrio nedwellii]|uniref:helix-turn-helix domain-containing protein n=1 Tax=Pseudodesulfovibrio nedwellii TaxID=2973072 RepID=UPI003369CC79